MPDLPLSHLRVVELGSGDALAFCGKLFADFGAEVIKVEPPGGDVARSLAPLIDCGAGKRESAYAAWLNTNKFSLTADLNDAFDITRVRGLLDGADLMLDSRLADIDASILSHRALRDAAPGLAITHLSWFGERGPYADYAATESVCRSLAGLVKLVGPVEGPPVLPRDGQTAIIAGLSAFIPSVAGLYGHTTGARRFALSTHEALLQISEFDVGLALESGFTRPRPGINRFGRGFPSGCFLTQRGWLGVTVVTPAQWVAFCEMIGEPALGADPLYSASIGRFTHAEKLNAIIKPALMRNTALHWVERGIALRIPLAVVPDMAELLTQDVHRARGVFAPVHIGDAAFDAPVLPLYLTQNRPKPNGRAPFAGEHNDHVWATRARNATRAAHDGDALPLHGVRIIDLTMGWAGPSATRNMADLGADVIKIESCQYPDWFRGTDTRPPYHAQRTYEKTYWFATLNRNKRGITLDLTAQAGRDLLKRLLADADAVIDNYAADVMPRLGLGTEAMRALNPRLVVMTMPAYASTSAWNGMRAYGSTLEQASGLPWVNGRADDPPTMLHAALGDPIGGLNAAAALLLGLMQQQRTGQGQHIDLSQVECMLPLAAPSIIEQSATGSTSPRLGNRHHIFVPQGCYPCLGEDQWITIAARSDDEWRALCDAIGRIDLRDDPALAATVGRRAQHDRIDDAIKSWTLTIRPDAAMVGLQEAGVAAGVARLPMDLPGDPHLMASGHWEPRTRPFMGPYLQMLAPYRIGDDHRPAPARWDAPTLGQHNHEVLRELLGLSDADIAALAADGVIGTAAIEKSAKPKTSA